MQILTVKNIEYYDDFFIIDYGEHKEKINYENIFEMYFYSYDRDNEIYKKFKEIHDSLPSDNRTFSKEQNKEICDLLSKNEGFKIFISEKFSQNAFISDENKKIKVFNSDRLDALSCELYFNNKLIGSAMLENKKETINWHPSIKEKFRGKGIGISFYKTMDEFAKMQKKDFLPSRHLSQHSYRVWKKLYPEKVKFYCVERGTENPGAFNNRRSMEVWKSFLKKHSDFTKKYIKDRQIPYSDFQDLAYYISISRERTKDFFLYYMASQKSNDFYITQENEKLFAHYKDGNIKEIHFSFPEYETCDKYEERDIYSVSIETNGHAQNLIHKLYEKIIKTDLFCIDYDKLKISEYNTVLRICNQPKNRELRYSEFFLSKFKNIPHSIKNGVLCEIKNYSFKYKMVFAYLFSNKIKKIMDAENFVGGGALENIGKFVSDFQSKEDKKDFWEDLFKFCKIWKGNDDVKNKNNFDIPFENFTKATEMEKLYFESISYFRKKFNFNKMEPNLKKYLNFLSLYDFSGKPSSYPDNIEEKNEEEIYKTFVEMIFDDLVNKGVNSIEDINSYHENLFEIFENKLRNNYEKTIKYNGDIFSQ